METESKKQNETDRPAAPPRRQTEKTITFLKKKLKSSDKTVEL